MAYTLIISGMVKSSNLYEISLARERVVAMATKDKKRRIRKSEPETQVLSEAIMVRRHRLVSAVGYSETLAKSGMMGTSLPDVVEHLGNQLRDPVPGATRMPLSTDSILARP